MRGLWRSRGCSERGERKRENGNEKMEKQIPHLLSPAQDDAHSHQWHARQASRKARRQQAATLPEGDGRGRLVRARRINSWAAPRQRGPAKAGRYRGKPARSLFMQV